MDTSGYVTFLLIGLLLVVVDGQLILRSGRTYLSEVYREPAVAASVSRLVTVLFHLVVLGVLALVSTVQVSGDTPVETVVTKIGILLLVLAVVHGATLVVFSRVRARQREQQLAEELTAQYEERTAVRPVNDPQHVVPAGGDPATGAAWQPTLSPSLEEQPGVIPPR